MKTNKLVYGAAIAAIYSALAILLAPISFGAFQVRIAEALTVLPAVTPAAIWGLFTGCLIANIFTGGISDIIFGSLTTLLAGYLSYKLRKNKWLVPLPPVLLNAVVVGGYLTYSYGGVLLLNMLTVGLGQLVSCYLLGMPLLMIIDSKEILK